MGFYNHYIMPRFVDFACGLSALTDQRRKIVPVAEGKVLEIGIGSGRNLPFYDPTRVERVIGVDPDDAMWNRAAKRRGDSKVPVERVGLRGDQIPLDDDSVDTAVITYSMCTIENPVLALEEIRRVLRPGGAMLFLEHGESPDPSVRKWQRRIDPIWKKLAGGCQSGRPIVDFIREAGWKVQRLEQGYVPGPRVLAYNYWGSARAA